jgi:hypothetical protein
MPSRRPLLIVALIAGLAGCATAPLCSGRLQVGPLGIGVELQCDTADNPLLDPREPSPKNLP